jgi:hypothetical protein
MKRLRKGDSIPAILPPDGPFKRRALVNMADERLCRPVATGDRRPDFALSGLSYWLFDDTRLPAGSLSSPDGS